MAQIRSRCLPELLSTSRTGVPEDLTRTHGARLQEVEQLSMRGWPPCTPLGQGCVMCTHRALQLVCVVRRHARVLKQQRSLIACILCKTCGSQTLCQSSGSTPPHPTNPNPLASAGLPAAHAACALSQRSLRRHDNEIRASFPILGGAVTLQEDSTGHGLHEARRGEGRHAAGNQHA